MELQLRQPARAKPAEKPNKSEAVRRNFAYLFRLKLREKCADCGKHYHPAALDLDHCWGDKVAGVSELCRRGVTLEDLMKEIAKCEVVCAVCHRMREFNRRILDGI